MLLLLTQANVRHKFCIYQYHHIVTVYFNGIMVKRGTNTYKLHRLPYLIYISKHCPQRFYFLSRWNIEYLTLDLLSPEAMKTMALNQVCIAWPLS